MKIKIVFFHLVFLAAAFFLSASARAENSFSAQAGWAEVEITPPLGLVMGGRGPTDTVGKKILDPLFAQVLFLKDSKGAGFVLVSFDLIGISHELSDKIRVALVHELGVEMNLIVVNTSHTHSGPQMGRSLLALGDPNEDPKAQLEFRYFDSLLEKIISAARGARKSMSPVGVEVFEGKSQVAINRRGKNKSGGRGIIPDPNGPIAEKVWVLKLTPPDGKAPAIIFSYACHPVIVYGFAGAAISADFPGVARNVLREKLGEKVHMQFVQGLAGDVRPRVVADVAKNRFRTPTPDDLQKAGMQMAGDVLAALTSKGKVLKLNIAGTMDKPFLPRGNPPPREVYETMLKTSKGKNLQHVANYWLQRYDSGEDFAKGDAWPTGLIRLADNQWIAYLAGEPCVEWGPKISQWLAPRNVVIFGYCQESNAYLPTEEMLPEGGYEVLDSNRTRVSTPAPFGSGINEAIRQSLSRQLSFIESK